MINYILLSLTLIFLSLWIKSELDERDKQKQINKLENDLERYICYYQKERKENMRLEEELVDMRNSFADQVKATDQAEQKYDILADKWRELNSKYANLLSEQQDGVVVTDTSKGEHDVYKRISQARDELKNAEPSKVLQDRYGRNIVIPFAEVIHQCNNCGSDKVRETEYYYICNNCGKRKRKE